MSIAHYRNETSFWTTENLKAAIEAHQAGLSYRTIAAIIGCSETLLSLYLRRVGYRPGFMRRDEVSGKAFDIAEAAFIARLCPAMPAYEAIAKKPAPPHRSLARELGIRVHTRSDGISLPFLSCIHGACISQAAESMLATNKRAHDLVCKTERKPVQVRVVVPVAKPEVVKSAPVVPKKRDVLDLRSTDQKPEGAEKISIGQDRKIMTEVSAKYGVSLTDMLSQRRDTPSVLARQIAMWRMRKETQLSMPHIGRILGGRDHTTILHGVRKIERMIAEGRAII